MKKQAGIKAVFVVDKALNLRYTICSCEDGEEYVLLPEYFREKAAGASFPPGGRNVAPEHRR